MNREPASVPIARRIAHVDDPALIKDSPQHVARAMIPAGNWVRHDPFLLMMEDDFGIGAFGMHPHRGIETITYVIEGALTHSDNRGNCGVLGSGDVQFMTAGSGGNGEFGATHTSGRAGQTLWLDRPTSGDDTELSVTAVTDLRVLLGAGEPLHEPVVAGGPFVMNTEAQIRQAFLDYRAGRFAPQ
ncbi:pirin family protein (plasmid) [Rhodococcus sp. USK10]|nr:pirin family protein [Rhodococcus sp. USK10]